MIPAANIYYLLCYAWDWMEGQALVDVDAVPSDNVQDLLGLALAEGTSRLLRLGIDRAYIAVQEEGRTPRGKIAIGECVNRCLHERGLVAYVADELSPDVLHNQLLAATIGRLARANVDPRVTWKLRQVARRFPLVSAIEPAPTLFRRVQLHRHNASYRFLLNLCELILGHLLPEGRTGAFRFHDFRANAQEMGLLFQEFVRNFLTREQHHFSVTAETVPWDVATEEPSQLQWLPRMQTDVSLVAPGRKVVIEVKYPANLFQTAFGGNPKLHSAHLYQLLSYLKNLEARGGTHATATGVLLYASAGQPLDLRYKIAGHGVLVRAVDLTRHWQEIRHDLLALIADVMHQGGDQRELLTRVRSSAHTPRLLYGCRPTIRDI
ncbi:MAG: hypothetical protein IT294_12215 [Deltaproteobacteria bacterium]|nr:hypothetical protein [Deltaproteobacteria bacterium]